MYCSKNWQLTGIFRLFCMLTVSNASCGGDRMQLQKVVNNLLSNAFKYTSDGGSISMELADGADECMFSVSDNGAGISEEDYVKIFRAVLSGREYRTVWRNGYRAGFKSGNCESSSGRYNCRKPVGERFML